MDHPIQLDLFESSIPSAEPRRAPTERKENRSGTFTDNMRLPVHRWFRYSAGFSAEWAERLIADLPRTEQPAVLDPFAGSGTVLLAAEKVGAVAYGFESHPFVFRVASGKLLWHFDERKFLEGP